MEKAMRSLLANEISEQLFVVNVTFWITVLLVRAFVFITGMTTYPTLHFFAASVSYSVMGVFLLLVALAFLFRRRTVGLFPLVAFGLGLAFVFDQAALFLSGFQNTNYWSLVNLVTILIAGGVLFLLYKVLTSEKKITVEYQGDPHKNPKQPKITVVIPAYNEEKFIGNTLKCLCMQTYKNFELIVVDNNSRDKTAEVAASYGARVVHEKTPGVSSARQAGFKAARGEIIATTDSDSIIPSFWVEKILREYEADTALVGFGGLGYLYSGPVTARAAGRFLFDGFWILDKILSGGWNLIGFNMSAKRRAFLKIGGFRTDLVMGEDIDLSQKLRKEGRVMVDLKFNIFVSGRRYKDGLFAGVMTYFPSWFMRVIFGQEKFLHFPAIRSELIGSSRFSYLPHVVAVFALIAMFYSRLL